ncbi:MAG: hypothetical protein LBP75_06950 [Planctomycetota bacterium]|jgi:hypothetical protein|nr:hypothetical protein [Planctomycetota bacterium]
MAIYAGDLEILQSVLPQLPKIWDGKQCVLELQAADYNWRQMEWWGFYFEFRVKQMLENSFTVPGDRFASVVFDLKRSVNWDIKAKAIKSDEHKVILNDRSAMEQSIKRHGWHGEIIGLCDVEYNDVNRSFQKWHTELKGGKSAYEVAREKRTAVSRYRKTKAELTQIVLLLLQEADLDQLAIMRQGRNSNGAPRPEKYMFDLETLDRFTSYAIDL